MRHNRRAPHAANARGTATNTRAQSLVQCIMGRHERLVHSRGQVVGYVQAGVFRKQVKGSCHILRKPSAWAFGIDSLDEAERLGAGRVELYDTETATTYEADLARIRTKGIAIDRGRGPQLALKLEEWLSAREISRTANGLVLCWLSVGGEA